MNPGRPNLRVESNLAPQRPVGGADRGMSNSLAIVVLLACVPAPAQSRAPGVGDFAVQVQRLSAPEPEQREDARRRLWRLPIDSAMNEVLLARVAAGGEAAPLAAAILGHAPGTHAALRALVDIGSADQALLLAAVPALGDDDLWLLARREASQLAEAAVLELAARGRLLDPRVIALLATDTTAVATTTAATILAEEYAQLPDELWRGVAAAPAAAERLLRALADHPRTGHAPWLERILAADATPAAVRLLALAALPPELQTHAHARLVLAELGDDTLGFLPDFAASRFGARVADGLIAGVHAAVLDGKDLRAMLPLLQNVSMAGEQHLLALASTEAAADAEVICRWLETRASPALTARVRAALAGEIALDDWWLRRAGPHLGDAALRQRVVAELAGGGERAALAFEALLDGERFEPAMVAYVQAYQGERQARMRDILRLPQRVLPVAFVRSLLADGDPTLRLTAVNALQVDPLDAESQAAVVARFAADGDDRVLAACARILTAFGDEAQARAAFARALGAGFGEDAVEWATERPRPFTMAMLGAARVETLPRRVLDEIDIGLVKLGDAAEPGDRARARALLGRLREMEPRLRKRAIGAVRPYVADDALAADVRALVEDGELDGMMREALVDTLLPRAAQEVAWLRARYEGEEDYDVRLGALRGLLASPAGEVMVQDLAAEFGRRALREGDEDLLQEVLGAAPLPLPIAVAELGLRAVLVAPLGNPVAEAAHTLSDLGFPADYPFVLPLTDLLRRGVLPGHGGAVRRVVQEALGARNAHALSRRRLGYLLGQLPLAGDPLELGGDALARAIVAAPDRDPAWLGPAHLLLGQRAEADADLVGAATAYRSAHEHFVRHRLSSVVRRRFLGEPDPARGRIPLAALAARGDLLLAGAAQAAGQLEAARAHLARAAVAADGDTEATQAVAALAAEVGR